MEIPLVRFYLGQPDNNADIGIDLCNYLKFSSRIVLDLLLSNSQISFFEGEVKSKDESAKCDSTSEGCVPLWKM